MLSNTAIQRLLHPKNIDGQDNTKMKIKSFRFQEKGTQHNGRKTIIWKNNYLYSEF